MFPGSVKVEAKQTALAELEAEMDARAEAEQTQPSSQASANGSGSAPPIKPAVKPVAITPQRQVQKKTFEFDGNYGVSETKCRDGRVQWHLQYASTGS